MKASQDACHFLPRIIQVTSIDTTLIYINANDFSNLEGIVRDCSQWMGGQASFDISILLYLRRRNNASSHVSCDINIRCELICIG